MKTMTASVSRTHARGEVSQMFEKPGILFGKMVWESHLKHIL